MEADRLAARSNQPSRGGDGVGAASPSWLWLCPHAACSGTAKHVLRTAGRGFLRERGVDRCNDVRVFSAASWGVVQAVLSRVGRNSLSERGGNNTDPLDISIHINSNNRHIIIKTLGSIYW